MRLVKIERRKSPSEIQRTQILILYGERLLSERQISIKIKISMTEVHQAIKKFLLCGSCKNLKRSGKPTKNIIREDNLMKRIVTSRQ